MASPLDTSGAIVFVDTNVLLAADDAFDAASPNPRTRMAPGLVAAQGRAFEHAGAQRLLRG